MHKYMLHKWGALPAALIIGLIAAVVSLAISLFVTSFLENPDMILAVSLSLACPLAIAPPLAYRFFKLLLEIEASKQEFAALNEKLQTALAEVNELSGLLPICASCKKVRNDEGYWDSIEGYIQEHSDAQFTHSMCPECAEAAREKIRAMAQANNSTAATAKVVTDLGG